MAKPILIRLIPIVRWRLVAWHRYVRKRLGACGQRPMVMEGSYTWSTLFLGDDVHIGSESILWAINNSRIVLGNKVLIGPHVTILSGDHNTSLAGRYMYDFRDEENRASDDQDVILEDDIWVGTRAIILKGVRIGRGSVIGAGAVVTKSVPPYSVVTGVPARPVKLRGSIAEIMAHEQKLYPPEKRLSEAVLIEAENAVASRRKAVASAPLFSGHR